jgi:hypothetical protein
LVWKVDQDDNEDRGVVVSSLCGLVRLR